MIRSHGKGRRPSTIAAGVLWNQGINLTRFARRLSLSRSTELRPGAQPFWESGIDANSRALASARLPQAVPRWGQRYDLHARFSG